LSRWGADEKKKEMKKQIRRKEKDWGELPYLQNSVGVACVLHSAIYISAAVTFFSFLSSPLLHSSI
jgi:hypothetical protein